MGPLTDLGLDGGPWGHLGAWGPSLLGGGGPLLGPLKDRRKQGDKKDEKGQAATRTATYKQSPRDGGCPPSPGGCPPFVGVKAGPTNFPTLELVTAGVANRSPAEGAPSDGVVLAADLTKGLFIPSAHVPLLPIAKGESLQGEGKFYIQPPLKGRLEGRPSCYNEPLGGDSRADRKGRGFPSLLSFQGRLHHNEGTGEGERIYAKVTADDGTEGWGEASPVRSWSYETPKSALSTIENYLGPAIVGMDPFDLASIHEVMDREIAPAFNIG
ncbi:MAG TPA: hypothetical protein EYP65_00165 [Armatimonadetes bacterium]|nr:hypothetical protein [Armatimonadota bacterium]